MENELKYCPGCKLDLPKDNEHFASRYDRKNKMYQTLCRKCQSEYRKEHYHKNKQKYIDKARNYTHSMIEWFIELKKTLKCENCPEDRYWVLDFHHRDPNKKDIEVSKLIRLGSKKKILNEIKKCKVLCSNCHRDLHYQEKMRV